MEDGGWVLVPRPLHGNLCNPPSMNDHSSNPLKVIFNDPAKHWTDALPIGNGRLGAMVWGGVNSELIQLNGKPKLVHFE